VKPRAECQKAKLLLGSLESSLELVKASACIDKLLLAGVVRMALGANVNTHFATLCGTRNNSFAACASDYAFLIIRMDSLFHFLYLTFNFSMFFDIGYISLVILPHFNKNFKYRLNIFTNC